MSTLPSTARPGDGSEPDLEDERDHGAPSLGVAGELSLIFGEDVRDRMTGPAQDPGPRSHETRAPAAPSRNARLTGIESAVGSLADRIEAMERLLRVAIDRLADVEAEARAAAESSHRVVQSMRDLPDRPFG